MMKKCSSFSEALTAIKNGSTVFVHGGAATPTTMLRTLCEEFNHLDLELIHLHTEGKCEYALPEYKNFKVTNLFTGKNLRGKIDHERIDYLPCFLSEIPMLFRSKTKKIDVALIQVSSPDRHGLVSLGVSVDVAKSAVLNAAMVIAQVNPKMPRIHGSGFLRLRDIDYFVEKEEEIYCSRPTNPSEEELKIGRNVAGLVEDGATLQLGIGAVPDAVAMNLLGHRHLGLHTEMWSHGAFELIKKGVIDNSKKKFHQGITTSSFIIGNRELYDFVHDNMETLNFESDYTNFPINVMRNPKVTAINSAVEIDLTGQVCADSVGHKIISGVGGQMDFMRAAALSQGGRPILALTSRTRKGISRITSQLLPGSGVVTTRSHVQYVVTEYGAVNLYGLTLNQRAKSLISIAHPDERERLEREWFEIKKKVLVV